MAGSSLLVVCVALGVGVVLGANPNYSYHVKIDDAAHANYQEKAETRKGPDAVGFYSVVDPNGSLRTVEYTADDRGFNPRVTYSHAGSHVYHQHGVATAGHAYAPAYVQDNRVQIVDKFKGPPPALNVAPFALPQPSLGLSFSAGSGPLVVPAPVRPAPPSHLIAQAQGVEYAPAYMPPVQAFVQQAQQEVYLPPQQVAVPVAQPVRTYVPPPPQVTEVTHQVVNPVPAPAPVSFSYLPPPQQSYPQYSEVQVAAPAYPQVQVTQEVVHPVRTYLPPPQVAVQVAQPVKTYLPPVTQEVQPIRTYLPPPRQEVVTYEQAPSVVAVEKPSLSFSLPRKQQVISVEKAQVNLVTDSYASAPINTISDPNSPVYPESIRVVDKVKTTYGPPNFTPGTPIGLEVERPVAVAVKKPVRVHVSVVAPPPQVEEVVHTQPAPQVHYAPAPQPQVHHVEQQQAAVAVPVAPQYHREVIHHAPAAVAAPVAQKVIATQPALGLYAGAIGYHTQSSGPAQYQHSYGTQGFQVTSSRQYNKVLHHQPAALPVRVATAPQVVHHVQQHAVPVAHQHVYAPEYIPAPAAPVVQVAHHHHHQAAVAVPVAAAPAYAPTATYLPPPRAAVAAPAVYGPVHTSAVANAAIPVPIGGKKQNPLTFSYGYEQGGAKVSHSYSGSGW